MVRTCNFIDNDHISNAFSYLNIVHFEGNKTQFEGSYDKQSLTAVVFYMKFMDRDCRDYFI